jgi:DNA repair exonuclease SbcCD ATPase subunit
MGKHEHFEDLCAAASIGQASGAELAELQQHLAECADCQQTYSEFLELSAVRCATGAREEELSGDEAIGYIDSALFRERFLKRAEAQGIVFSRANVTSSVPEPETRTVKHRRWKTRFALAVAASVLLACASLGGYYFGGRGTQKSSALGTIPTPPVTAPAGGGSVAPPFGTASEAAIARLEAENRRLTSEIAALRASLADTSSALGQLQATSVASDKERASLLAIAMERDAQIADLQRRLDQAQVQVASVRTQLETVQTSNQVALGEDQAKIHELSEQLAEQSAALEREREMLTADRDIRDLMAARNLHIADVFDTDPRGKTRPAFGRIFFTEGKSLLFYAYDLNEHHLQEAGYHYRVWGKKEGPGQRARSLGVFFSDDKSQRRWVFRYDDPKVLSEIDSVFVTLEPPGKNPTEPKGEKHLYAYLRNQANHP